MKLQRISSSVSRSLMFFLVAASPAKAALVNVASLSNSAIATAISYGTYNNDPQYPWEAIDGDFSNTGWSSNGSMPAWYKVEFSNVYSLEAVDIWWGSHQHTFSVSTSLDSNSWTNIIGPRVSTNVEAGPVVLESYDFDPIDAKFIKVDITTTSAPGSHIFQASIFEFAAYSNNSPAPVPEPATMLLLGSGLVGLAGFRWRFKKR